MFLFLSIALAGKKTDANDVTSGCDKLKPEQALSVDKQNQLDAALQGPRTRSPLKKPVL